MKDQQLKILQIMSQATNRMDLNMLAEKISLNPTETIQQMQELADQGLLVRAGGGYRLSSKGKTAIKACAQLPDGYEFNFYTQIDQPTGQSAKSIADFYNIIKQVDAASLVFHLNRGDFERWIIEALNDEALARQVAEIKKFDYRGEMLRGELLEVIDEHYNIRELL